MLNKIFNKKPKLSLTEELYEKYRNFTMIDSHLFQQNIQIVKEHFKEYDRSGILVECGVWRGGMSAALAELLGKKWEYHLFDSFEGLPPAEEIDGAAAIKWQSDPDSDLYFDNCKAEISFAMEAMKIANVEPQIHKGWFKDTVPQFKINKPISLLRLDGDWYESTMTCLSYLYPLVEENGLILIDDYFAWDGCSKAVHDYLSSIKSNSRIRTNEYLCYIIKTENGRQY